MKSYYLAILFLFCVGVPEIAAQKNTEAVEITAVRLQERLVPAFLKFNIAAFTVSEKGVLRPTKYYRMYWLKAKGKVVIQAGDETTYTISGGYDSIPLPDGAGAAHCMCDKGADDCVFEFTEEHGPGRTDFVCKGSCGCGVWVELYPDEGIADYETPGGGWFGF